jgi:hypothetical protein
MWVWGVVRSAKEASRAGLTRATNTAATSAMAPALSGMVRYVLLRVCTIVVAFDDVVIAVAVTHVEMVAREGGRRDAKRIYPPWVCLPMCSNCMEGPPHGRRIACSCS